MFSSKFSENNLLVLHLIVLLWGTAGLIGDSIELPSLGIVFYRMFFAFLSVAAYLKFFKREVLRVSWSDFLKLTSSGIMLAIHWWFFFQSIKVSTVSIGLVCLSSAAFFLSIFEPLLAQKRFKKSDTLIGICCVASLLLIYNFETSYVNGIILGLLAAATDALYSIVTSKLSQSRTSSVVTLYQMLGGAVFVALIGLWDQPNGNWLLINTLNDFYGLLFLGIMCSAFAMVVYIWCLKGLPTFTVVLAINMEPIYGILLTILVRGDSEYMSLGFYFGALLLISCLSFDILYNHVQSKKTY